MKPRSFYVCQYTCTCKYCSLCCVLYWIRTLPIYVHILNFCTVDLELFVWSFFAWISLHLSKGGVHHLAIIYHSFYYTCMFIPDIEHLIMVITFIWSESHKIDNLSSFIVSFYVCKDAGVPQGYILGHNSYFNPTMLKNCEIIVELWDFQN